MDGRLPRGRAVTVNPRLQRLLTITTGSALIAVPVVFLALFFYWPVGAMLSRGFFGEGTLDVSGFVEVLRASHTWRVVWQTIWMAAAGTLGSVLLGIPGAYVLYCCEFPGRRIARAIVAIPFVLPTVVVGIAFRALFTGPLAALGLGNSSAVVVIAMVFFNYSVIVRTVGTMWAQIDPRSAGAARTLGASPTRAFFTITLAQLGPSIAAGASLVFLFCSTAYGIVQTLGRPGYGTLESEIWVQTTTYLDLRTAAALSVLQVAIVVIALIISTRTAAASERALRLGSAFTHRLTHRDLPLAIATVTVVAVLLVAPMAALVLLSFRSHGQWTVRNYHLLTTPGEGFSGGTSLLEALHHSVAIALDATMIALPIGMILAYLLSRRPRSRLGRAGQHLLDSAALMPLGVSAVTVGFGFFIALNHPPLDLRGSPLLVPLAQAVVALPMVVRALVPVARAIDPRMRDAAATLGAGPWRVFATIDFPFMLRGLGIAAGFALAMSLGEFGATSFLASPDYTTLPVQIVKLLSRPGMDNYGMALAGAVILAMLTGALIALAELARPSHERKEARS